MVWTLYIRLLLKIIIESLSYITSVIRLLYIPPGIIRSARHGRVLRRRRNKNIVAIGTIRHQPEQTDSDRPAGHLTICGRYIRRRITLRGRCIALRSRIALRGRVTLLVRAIRSHPLRRRPICCSSSAVRLCLLDLPVRGQDLGFPVHSHLLPMIHE